MLVVNLIICPKSLREIRAVKFCFGLRIIRRILGDCLSRKVVWIGKLKEKGIQYKPQVNPKAKKVKLNVPLHEDWKHSFLEFHLGSLQKHSPRTNLENLNRNFYTHGRLHSRDFQLSHLHGKIHLKESHRRGSHEHSLLRECLHLHRNLF